MDNTNAVSDIADNIIKRAGGGALPEEAKDAFHQNLEAQITRRLGLIIMEHLDKAGLEAYERLVKNNPTPPASELQSFLEQYLPDYGQKIKAGMGEFMEEISGFIKNAK